MTLPEQTAILLEAIEDELLQPEDIVRWADPIIVAMEKPPMWIIDLSTLGTPHMVDCVWRLREQATEQLPQHCRIQIVALAHQAALISSSAALSKLFRIKFIERRNTRTDTVERLDEELNVMLIKWDCQDDLDVIEPPFQEKLNALFREYLKNADDVVAILPWKFSSSAQKGV